MQRAKLIFLVMFLLALAAHAGTQTENRVPILGIELAKHELWIKIRPELKFYANKALTTPLTEPAIRQKLEQSPQIKAWFQWRQTTGQVVITTNEDRLVYGFYDIKKGSYNIQLNEFDYWPYIKPDIVFHDPVTGKQIRSNDDIAPLFERSNVIAYSNKSKHQVSVVILHYTWHGNRGEAHVFKPKQNIGGYNYQIFFPKKDHSIAPQVARDNPEKTLYGRPDQDTRQFHLSLNYEDEVPDFRFVFDIESLTNVNSDKEGNTYDVTMDTHLEWYPLKWDLGSSKLGLGLFGGGRFTIGGQDKIEGAAFRYFAHEMYIGPAVYWTMPTHRLTLIGAIGYADGRETDTDLSEPKEFRSEEYCHTFRGIYGFLECQYIFTPIQSWKTQDWGAFHLLDRVRVLNYGLYGHTDGKSGAFDLGGDDIEYRDFFTSRWKFGVFRYTTTISNAPFTLELYALSGIDIYRRLENETADNVLNMDLRGGVGLNATLKLEHWTISFGVNYYRAWFVNEGDNGRPSEPHGNYWNGRTVVHYR